jgi:hypothetical protein
MAQVWSATQINSNLSGGGTTTVTMGGTSTNVCVFGSNGVSSGKFYWETACTSASFDLNVGQGIGNTSSSIANGQYLGEGTDTCALYGQSGGTQSYLYYNNANAWLSTAFVLASGNRVGHALDLVNGLYWVSDITLATGWYGSSGSVTGNPASGTNGFALSGTTIAAHPVVPGLIVTNNGDVGNGYFLPASWLGAAPSGFVALSAPVFSDSGGIFDASLISRSGNDQRITDWL